MRVKSKKIAVTAMMTALSVVFLYLSSVLPAGRTGFAAAASLFGIAAVIEAGVAAGGAVFCGSLLLAFLLLPNKNPLILYGCFFGYYPILKSLAERCRSRAVEWLLKLAVLNAALTVIVFLFSETIFDLEILNGRQWMIYLLCNAVFAVFDFGVSKLIAFYMSSISKHLKNKRI